MESGLFSVAEDGSLHLNPLNPELKPICYLLALLGAHDFLHVSRIRVKLLTLTYLLTPWSRVLLEKLTSKLCS